MIDGLGVDLDARFLSLVDHSDPGNIRLDLVDQVFLADALLGKDLIELCQIGPVLGCDLSQRLVDVLLGHLNAKPLGFLHLQFFIDKAAQNLRSHAPTYLDAVFHAGRSDDHGQARFQIEDRDDVAIYNGSDAQCILRRDAYGQQGGAYQNKRSQQAGVYRCGFPESFHGASSVAGVPTPAVAG